MPKLPAALERSAILQAIRSADQAPQIVEYDRYVTDHIRRTGRAVQATEIAFALMGLAVGWLCFLLAAAVAEHWLTERGFSDGFRYFLFAVAVLATGWYAKVLLWPLVTGRINPLYTAKAIEESAPTLKNSLINLLTLRGSGRQLPPAVLATLEQHAAEGISRAPEEAVVDRSRVVRMAAVMVGLLAAVALYALISTKDPFTTAARIVAPWAKIAPPSRVRISDVTPGDVTLVEGQTLEIEARVDGLGEGEQVDVVLTSADGQRVDDRQRLAFDDDLNRFTVSLPTLAEPGQRAGLSGRVRYRVEAGDGRTPTYVLNVLPAPAIVVSAVDYNFPAYTGLLDYTQEKSGELRAIEGSRVTLHAQANTELESAYVDFDADGSRDLPMQVDGDTATASFDLALRPDRQTPKHGSYVLRLKTAAGLANAKPAKHAIEVYPDYPPEAALTFPEEPELTIRQNDTIAIRGTARDPDFALSDVRVFAERDGRRVLHKRLLTRSFQGKYNAEFAFKPTDHGLRAGDVVEYWLEASDNRQPEPQTVVTGRQTFRIASPDARGDRRPDELADAGENGESGEGGPDQGRQGDQGDAGEQAGGGDQGESGQSPDGQNGQGQEGQDGQEPDQSQQGDSGDSQPGQQQEQDGAGQESQNQQGQGEPDQQQRESNDAGQRGSQQQPQDESGDEQQEQQDQQSGEGGQGLQTQDQGADSNSEEPLQGQQGESQDSSDQNNGQSSGGQKGSSTDSGQQNNQQGGGGNESGKQTGSRVKPGDDGAGNGDGSPTPQEQPIDDSGAEDGEAFERMLDHMEQNGDQGQNSGRQPREAAPQDHPTDSGESADQSDGAGADTMGGDLNNKPQERPQDGGESGESPGGKQQSPRGDQSTPGAAGEPQGSPTTENDRAPTEKSRDQPAPNEGDSEEAQSPASDRNKTEMDEQGDQGGEKSGAGAEGGGQRADQQGSGSDGQNQASDEGGGRAQEQGQGDPGSQAGADQQSDTQTGESGRDTGEGSTERPGQGDKPGGQQSNPQGGESQDASESGSQSDQSSSRPDDQQQPQPNDNQQPPPSDASQPGQGAPGQSQQEGADGEQSDAGSSGGASAGPTAGGDVGGDKANLDYARQKTDLVLEKLSDQLKEGEVDPELLDKLGWNEDQLRRFVERWNQRKQAARRAPNSKAEAELDAALRGLGRLPGSPASKTSRTIDELRNNAGARYAPAPLKWRERLQRYNQGVSGAGD